MHQPIAFCIDDRGRLWVAEAYAYPRRLPFAGPVLPEDQKKNGDRILIFEDTDGDGKFDKRTVFMEGLNLVSGLEVGFGGVWVGAAPYLMFIPTTTKTTSRPGRRRSCSTAGTLSDTHETLNTFTWGPDGWLYGCHGVFTHSRVGKPGTPDKDRTPINAGVWRYHPTRHIFEVFADGTSNPWGLDFNDQGEVFIEACVIPHCFHMIQGGRYQRQARPALQPVHLRRHQDDRRSLHYLGATPHGGNNRIRQRRRRPRPLRPHVLPRRGLARRSTTASSSWATSTASRINMDMLKTKGSGYVASHGPDFLLANDAWARFINLKYGPDGNVYLIDWYDKQACHLNNPEVWDRTNGRIYKISYRGTKPVAGIDLQKVSDQELVELSAEQERMVCPACPTDSAGASRRPNAARRRRTHEATALEKSSSSPRTRTQPSFAALWALHVLAVGEQAISPRTEELRPGFAPGRSGWDST